MLKKTDYNTNITEKEGKIPSITGLITNFESTTVENKIPDVRSLIKETGYDTKINEIITKVTYHDHDKYITTSQSIKLAS